ncbi:hypothetical protein NQ315_015416 [Exocentrus adspersus]|uniref:Uncharacterized protein n=1 Tax=Exocentrus adspersus TaxID=1586481 RepID=A0AAV8VLT2_9CUCU|nr:hypothetical protein NQ315_015416 [Exocentrus adspersus]
MVTATLLVVALSVASAAPIFDLGGDFLCSSIWSYCDYEDDSKEKTSTHPIGVNLPGNGGISIHNSVAVSVTGNIGTAMPNPSGTPGNGIESNGTTNNGIPSTNGTPSDSNGNNMASIAMPSNGMPTSTGSTPPNPTAGMTDNGMAVVDTPVMEMDE